MNREQITAMLAGLETIDGCLWFDGAPVVDDTIRALCELALEGLDMQSALDQAEVSGGLTENGNLWRFWRDKAAEYSKQADERVAKLRAENERLRTALINICEAEAAFIDQITRAALERKPE